MCDNFSFKSQSKYTHSIKSRRIRSFPGQYFPTFGLNRDQKNSEYEHFSRSDMTIILL